MARYRQLLRRGKDGWYLVNPSNLLEALIVAWYLWRHPAKVAALVGVTHEFIADRCEPENNNADAD